MHNKGPFIYCIEGGYTIYLRMEYFLEESSLKNVPSLMHQLNNVYVLMEVFHQRSKWLGPISTHNLL